MKTIPIQPLSSYKIERELPPLPRAFLDEVNHLINVTFNGSGTLLENINLAYDLIDKVNREFVSTFTSCSKGCSHCCRMDVQLTTFEAEYIYMSTGISHIPKPELTIKNKGACPFLSSAGECSIYAYRPLFCRTYHVVSDPKLCGILDASIAQYGSMEGNMGNALYWGVASWIHFHNQNFKGSIGDIRNFFPHPPQEMQKHIAVTRRFQS